MMSQTHLSSVSNVNRCDCIVEPCVWHAPSNRQTQACADSKMSDDYRHSKYVYRDICTPRYYELETCCPKIFIDRVTISLASDFFVIADFLYVLQNVLLLLLLLLLRRIACIA